MPHDAKGTIAAFPPATLLAEIARLADAESTAGTGRPFGGCLREACQMGDAQALADGIVHDFRNYMQIALGSLEAIREHLHNGRSDKAAGRVEAALQALHGADTLAQHFATSARTKPHGAHPLRASTRVLRVNDAITGLESLFRSALGEHIKLDLSLGNDLPCIRCDRLQLESALLNLATNARDAMPTERP